MDRIVVQDFNLDLNPPEIIEELRISKAGSSMVAKFTQLLENMQKNCRPKGLYRPVEVERVEDDQATVEGVLLKSRVLAVQLEDVHRIFPFIATCGKEAAALAHDCTNMLERFWMESILDKILQAAITRTREDLAHTFGLKKTVVMTPGSLDDWPLEEQAPLFSLLGDVEGEVGVRLLDSFMMTPRQSISGIMFPAETNFQSCMLCNRKRCPKRRADYDQGLYDRRFRKRP
ncbi:vitamin B12 dependent-methionine synthase activation domain-containing protein [Desulfatibacillum alkenivorans]|nr:vitamin B12 dependent-methionine synthase activation domain-containing protein [Desulfatibacillum alkenivorans]